MSRKKKRHSIADILRELLSYNGKLKLPILISLLFAAAGAVLTIIGPGMLRDITDIISNSLFAQIDLAAIGEIGVKLLIIYLISAVLTYVEHYIMATVTLELSRDLRRDLSRKINVVPMSYFNTVSFGDILSRVTNDVSTLQQALANSLPSMISSVAQFVGCLIMMFVTEWRMALAAVAVTAVGFGIMGVAMLRSQKYFTARQKNLSKLNGYVEEMYSGHDVVRISRANDQIKDTFGEMNDELYDADWHSQFLSGIMQPLMTVIGNLGYVAVCVIGAALVMDGQIGFGVIVAFIMYVRLFTSPLSTLAQGMTQMQTAAAAGGHIPALYRMGRCYAQGIGVARDMSQAAEIYQAAAQRGDPDAMVSLAWCYEHGEGVPQDKAEAAKWYQRGAQAKEAKENGRSGPAPR